MATEVVMPQMGESIAEGTITRWLVAVGETVERDQPLLEISTDKVDAEVPAPASGVLLEIKFGEGETVEVDTVIGAIGAEGEAVLKAPAKPAARSNSEVAPHPAGTAGVPSASGGTATLEERVRVSSSPVVRKIAAKENVDLAEVVGTGVHGRVTRKDIEAYLELRRSGAAPSVPAAAASGVAAAGTWLPPGFEYSVKAHGPNEVITREPMSRIRRLTAAHMLYSQQTSAHVATVFDVDLSSVVAARQRARKGFLEKTGTKLTYMPFFFRAACEGLKAFPKFNAAIEGTDIIYKRDIHLGMAVALDWGLIVPVIHNADQLNIIGLAERANDLAERARARQLKPEEIQGGTFTVTNPGVFGSLFGTPLINQPQVAILCLGAIEKRPVVVTDEHGNDSISIRPMAYLCLSYDHRLIDGADAERFMVEMKRVLVTDPWTELDPMG